jgi:hypothetical protein
MARIKKLNGISTTPFVAIWKIRRAGFSAGISPFSGYLRMDGATV